MTYLLLQGDARHIPLADESVNCVVTSPPYWGLRDYGVSGQLGLEPTPDEYVAHMVEVFREVRRVLKPTGTCWLNIGDSYAGSGNGSGDYREKTGLGAAPTTKYKGQKPGMVAGLKPKDLCGIPWRVAFALQADGWWLRDAIIWAKAEMTEDWQTEGSTMPGSQQDRCTSAYEFVFMLTKRERYWWDGEAIKSATSWPRNVWRINPKPYSGAHYATFPPKLAERCILAGCPAQVCAKCGKPWERVVERTSEPDLSAKGSRFDKGKTGVNGEGRVQEGERYLTRSIGFRPTCDCDGVDRRLVASPTGERAGDDPSMETGRAGLNRPRGENEGQRPITRYEQAQYARQLVASPHRAEMETDAGQAFAHYIRTDDSGARPVPDGLLETWLERGWLERVIVPPLSNAETVPGVVFDPFVGSGTTVAVAVKLGRRGIGLDLSGTYLHENAQQRVAAVAPMLAL